MPRGINYLKPLPLCVLSSVGGPATLLCQIADAYPAVIHQMAVALEHTARGMLSDTIPVST